ncbi:MAG: hypothetical protein ACLFPJ_05235 [Candidatus Woesearchaeota archaeon]
MCTINYNETIKDYLRANSKITAENLGILILIDKIYEKQPKDIKLFRQKFHYFNPELLDNTENSEIIFFELLKSKEPLNVIKHRLNSYINLKLNYIDSYKSFNENLKTLKRYSFIVSSVIDDLLKATKFPQEIIEIYKEDKLVTECHDFYSLFLLYKKTKSKKIKFEIMRKIGLIELILRIRRSFNVDNYDFGLDKVKKLFKSGLGMARMKEKKYYLWLDEEDRVVYTQNKKKATKNYEIDLIKRQNLGKSINQMQTVILFPSKTMFGNIVLNYETRNKFRRNGDLSYSSFIEKVIRKNIEFPLHVRDILGVKLIVETEDNAMQFVEDLERFLGGISTRKKEKNALSKFGKKKLSEFSSNDYFVWKAVYDVTLPNPYISDFEKIMSFVKNNKEGFNFLKSKIDYFKNHPTDFIVEVQLQDLSSYFQSLVKGSSTMHDGLKMRQIRVNSLHKLFPQEIFNEELKKLKKDIIKKS